ncbi:Gfo/Idh/MocA family oxidoreductase [Catenovulum maritimum]|uniref:Myo-inositol 2-dehydrogenase n=1 Tax=Catenovulum maritimum TaxID=1513271 RepID=A0A0J8GPK6_9ALTE|nr:Gfo/Idh/MocA family oxidoreductase [Catenovulum maritimum]KMT64740.1 myo-inositol 2-dehydrogenase [Catenovulum maritimum]
MIWLIGAGGMSVDYVKVLAAQEQEFKVIGRSESSATTFEEKTGQKVVVGGVEKYLETSPQKPDAAIVSVGIDQLYNTTMMLLEYGVDKILVEKPGAKKVEEIRMLANLAREKNSKVFIAYNRRFYASVCKLKENLMAEGGITSFNFEFTEWAHVIETLNKPKDELSNWFLANSTHVVDLAFHLGGKPRELSSYVGGELEWHPSGAVFSGAGISVHGALFNYMANWSSAGRWSLEFLTKKSRYYLKPMEKIQRQLNGTIKIEPVEIESQLDDEFKPGLYLQTKAFLEGDSENLCHIDEHVESMTFYQKIANY